MCSEPRQGAPRTSAGEAGMTLVEVMVATCVLLIGMLGVFAMLDAGNAVTSDNLARDAASGLAREQLEHARQLPYTDLASSQKVAEALTVALDSGPEAPIAAAFTTTRRGVAYRTTITTCVLDDPSDGVGVTEGKACQPRTPPPPDDNDDDETTGTSLNVLGFPVTVGGALGDVLCGLAGENSILAPLLGRGGTLSGLISNGAELIRCDGGVPVVGDSQAADVTAVTTTVTWPRSPSGVTQRTLVSGPRVAP